MLEKLGEDFYRVEVPLPNSPLKYLNSYVIKGPRRNLIVDTGMNRTECLEAMQEALGKLKVDLARTDFFITHLHSDHLGLVGRLAGESCRIYFNRQDAEKRQDADRWEKIFNFAKLNGFPQKELSALLKQHPGLKYQESQELDFTILQDGDCVTCGGYNFVCVHAPGHTNGHLCLYEPARKWFIAGDVVLGDITPNIPQWNLEDNLLAQYLDTLDKVRGMDISLVLPGHRRLIHDHCGRIDEIKEHHRVRLEEILRILASGPSNAFALAGHMKWDIASDWSAFPVTQKWFATGEAMAHLAYLRHKGQVACHFNPEGISYALEPH